ncbi:hypothetical protein ES703_56410 [subsurface metagenome]|jgi:predicted GIY-YIG superfamily endonuclease
MALSGHRFPFTEQNVNNAPTDKGVYALYDENVTIYIGKGDGENGIRERLQRHKRGDEGKCTQEASHYCREPCSNPATREKALLEEYKQTYEKLPRCNDVMP